MADYLNSSDHQHGTVVKGKGFVELACDGIIKDVPCTDKHGSSRAKAMVKTNSDDLRYDPRIHMIGENQCRQSVPDFCTCVMINA